ncbi:MAG: TetR/AcrR family transcriptional regulator [Acidimicrobiia bacterium]|nr:TetR/AcrR family transcriptional regulator [Acidimicrobiia bacterium]MDH5237965.1 TetR/AcrR family transcriptional regulator [Acidimicrobiia bacterium]
MSTTRKLLPRAERQEAIHQAAARAFGRTGFAATSMEEVAAEAGVTKVLVYRHVESKESLYRSVLEQTSASLRQEYLAAAAESMPDAAIVAHLATARADPDGYRLLFVHAEREPEFAGYAAEIMGLLVAVADELFGQVVPSHLRHWATRLTTTMLVHAVLGWMESGDAAHDAEFRQRTAAGLAAFVGQIIDDSPPESSR